MGGSSYTTKKTNIPCLYNAEKWHKNANRLFFSFFGNINKWSVNVNWTHGVSEGGNGNTGMCALKFNVIHQIVLYICIYNIYTHVYVYIAAVAKAQLLSPGGAIKAPL